MKTTLALLAMLVAVDASAWGEAGHLMSNEAATLALPNDLPHFFYRSFPELVWLGYDPDRWKGSGVSIDADNNPEHFIDYEFVQHLKLPPNRYEFLALLESSGTLRRKGLENSEVGFVVWRIAELSEQLTGQFRQWRAAPAGSAERRFLESTIINTAGILGHYVSDAANPHHTTINYNGWVMPNPNGYPVDCGAHSRFETTFVSHAVEREDFIGKIREPKLRSDYFATALAFVLESNSLVEEMYRLDRDGAFDIFRDPVSPQGMAFTTDRLAAGSSLLRDLWWSAWRNSAQPRRRRSD